MLSNGVGYNGVINILNKKTYITQEFNKTIKLYQFKYTRNHSVVLKIKLKTAEKSKQLRKTDAQINYSSFTIKQLWHSHIYGKMLEI